MMKRDPGVPIHIIRLQQPRKLSSDLAVSDSFNPL